MKNLLIPQKNIKTCEKSHWVESNVALLGFFYDYLCDPSGLIIGLRYWKFDNDNFLNDAVFSQFIEDERFYFDSSKQYVNIVFDTKSCAFIEEKIFGVVFAQDFGGCSVVQCNSVYGLSIDIENWRFNYEDILWSGELGFE